MGTNYYYEQKPRCECCDRPFEELHIGKSSAGWCFSLRTYPEMRITTLDKWVELFQLPGSTIYNEYGGIVSVENMLKCITERKGELRRHDVDYSHCTGHGEGTYDYCVGEFC